MTEGRPTPCLCRPPGALDSDKPGDRGEVAHPDVKGHAGQQGAVQTVPSDTIIYTIVPIQDVDGGKLRLAEGRQGLSRPHVLGGACVWLRIQCFLLGGWGADILVFPASSCPREKPAQEAVGSPSCPCIALTLLWRKPPLRDI